MIHRRFIYQIIVAIALSTGFVLTAIYSYAWVTHIPKVGFDAVIRIFYMPHALAAALTLDAIYPRRGSQTLAYILAFVVTLPISFLYAVAATTIITWLKRWVTDSRKE